MPNMELHIVAQPDAKHSPASSACAEPSPRGSRKLPGSSYGASEPTKAEIAIISSSDKFIMGALISSADSPVRVQC
jgi:hypothetical protein